MGLFSRRCPVGDDAGAWTERSMGWLREQFGDDPLGPEIVLPDHIPGDFTGGEDVAHDVLKFLCEHMSVDPAMVTLEVTIFGEDGRQSGAGYRENGDGHYRRHDGRQVIEINPSLLTQPLNLVARIAHDLGHTRLLGEERITTDRRDHEQLADLLTIYFGLGIVTANASYDSETVPFDWLGRSGRVFSRFGFLPEPMFGYGLACYAWLRDEPWPSWPDHLDHGPRTSMKAGLDYLERVAEPGRLPGDR